ncbi:MAG: phosphotransferase [bacterium]
MLETTLKTAFIPGTNLSGGLASADWRFLLPSLKCNNILCVGTPSADSLAVLSTMGQFVFVVSTEYLQLQKILKEAKTVQAKNIGMIHVKSLADLPFADHTIELIYEVGRKGKVRSFRGRSLLFELARILKWDGKIFFEIKGLANSYRYRKALQSLLKHGFEHSRVFWLAPLSGRMQTALPLSAGEIANYFFTNVLYGQSLRKRSFSHVGRVLSRYGLLGVFASRRAVLIQRSQTNGHLAQPPKYLISIAEKAGLDLTEYRFGLSTRGQGNSNKAIFYLFEKSVRMPKVVIKMTRAPEFNYRLENEYGILTLLKEKGFVGRDTFPEPLFLNYHNNLAVLGMKAVEGEPFRTRTEATENCPVAHDAINWIVQLGKNSVNKSEVSPGEVSKVLLSLLKRINEIYNLSDEHRDFLTQQISSMKLSNQDFPLVLQHGDPGTWNILVSKHGNVIFIDWEAGETRGLPLWDLFYFFRTYASWICRTQGSRDSLKNFAQHFLVPSDLVLLLHKTTVMYCEVVGLDKRLIEPLFYTCWMHRALKESTRLTPQMLDTGHYVNLLRLVIDHRNAPTLKRMFTLEQASP